jgi:hypothetical protein
MIEGQRTSRRGLLLIAFMSAVFALGIAACSSGDADAPPTTTNTIAATTTTALLPDGCDDVTGLFPVSAVLDLSDGWCREWVDQSVGRAVLGSTGSVSVWSRRTEHGTAVIVGAVHTLGQGWFGPADAAVVEAIVDPASQMGVPRLFLLLPDGSGPDSLASPWFGLYNPSIAAERNSNLMQDVLPREDFYVAATDRQKLDVSGLPPVPEPIVHGRVPLYDPLNTTAISPTFAETQPGVLVLVLGYPNETAVLTAGVGRVLSDDDASRAVDELAALGDPEGSIPYDSEAEMIIEGAAAAGMSGGPVVDEQGRLVGVLVRATSEHQGLQYVRAVRMSYVADRVAAAFDALPLDTQRAIAGYLEH